MKNSITQFSLFIIAFVALTLLMSYTRPAADEPKQYILIYANGSNIKAQVENLQRDVNQKISAGWHLQGGMACEGGGVVFQAMVK